MLRYHGQKRILVAVDCIIFGFDGENLKLLLIQRSFEPKVSDWSLMGGFLRAEETLQDAANRILKTLTGLEGVYMEQLHAFSNPKRDPVERTICVAYFALIDINKYQNLLKEEFHAEWFLLDEIPELIFDHNEMVERAKKQLKYKASLHPILFELLPERFTIPQLQDLYEGIYGASLDSRNFSRKLLSTGLLVKLNEKDKSSSKKGAYYFKLDKEKYEENFEAFLSLVPNTDKLLA